MSRRSVEWSIVRYQVRCSNGHDVERGQVVRWGMRMATCAACLQRQGIEAPTVEDLRLAEARASQETR